MGGISNFSQNSLLLICFPGNSVNNFFVLQLLFEEKMPSSKDLKSSITFSGLVINNTAHEPILTCNHLIKKE